MKLILIWLKLPISHANFHFLWRFKKFRLHFTMYIVHVSCGVILIYEKICFCDLICHLLVLGILEQQYKNPFYSQLVRCICTYHFEKKGTNLKKTKHIYWNQKLTEIKINYNIYLGKDVNFCNMYLLWTASVWGKCWCCCFGNLLRISANISVLFDFWKFDSWLVHSACVIWCGENGAGEQVWHGGQKISV